MLESQLDALWSLCVSDALWDSEVLFTVSGYFQELMCEYIQSLPWLHLEINKSVLSIDSSLVGNLCRLVASGN